MANASTLPVAVVIPCFNDGSTVMEAVESALAEGPAEIVVVNDGSTDPGTLEAFSQLRQRGVRVIDRENGGLAAARMTGVEETTSPFVMVLDADDCIAPGALRTMADALARDPRLGVVWGDVERFGAAGYLRYPKARSLDPWRITVMNELVASTLVRRTSLIEAGGWTLTRPFEDWDLWMSMAERGIAGLHVGCVTLRYRVDEPRMYRNALRDYPALMTLLRTRHADLFAARRTNRRRSASPRRLKWVWTLAEALPIPQRLRRYVVFAALVACEPSRRRARSAA
jgi:glycosyltransferase involved in cell wall biosynthesis